MTSVISTNQPDLQHKSATFVGAFALRHTDNCHYLFGWSGQALTRLSGRALRDHDFLGLWGRAERNFVRQILDDVRLTRQPKSIPALAYNLDGQTWPCHFDFTPLAHPYWHGTCIGCRWHANSEAGLPDTPLVGLSLRNT